jgi:hypothetical protein
LFSQLSTLEFPVNPKALARYREAFNVGGAKDDPTGGDLLLELVTRSIVVNYEPGGPKMN